MTNPIDPLEHIPDPDKRYQVFGVMRSEVPFIEVLDSETGTGFVMDLLSALELSADVSSEAARILGGMARHERGGARYVDPESVDRDDPRWQQEVWRRPSEN